MNDLTHIIPSYNWRLTERFLTTIKYLEGRDYTVKYSKETVTLKFNYRYQFERYWDQWGKHIVKLPQ